jgi:hypothetical protein
MRRRRISTVGSIILSALIAALPVRAQATGWQEDLAGEIDLTKHCKVSFLSQVVERTVDGKRLVMAKAHCEDGRTFDVLRPDEFEPFQFNECQPEAAQAC